MGLSITSSFLTAIWRLGERKSGIGWGVYTRRSAAHIITSLQTVGEKTAELTKLNNKSQKYFRGARVSFRSMIVTISLFNSIAVNEIFPVLN